jgi:hypothetical protein
MSNLKGSAELIRAESKAKFKEKQKLMEPRDWNEVLSVSTGSEAIPVCARGV